MDAGFSSLKDVFDVLVVPLTVGSLALLWPSWLAYRRRQNFRYLLREELKEAKPKIPEPRDKPQPWHRYLSRRFLHEEIIRQAAGNTDFLLSLNPRLAYVLSQMWISFDKGKAESDNPEHAAQWIWYLGQTCVRVDRSGGEDSLVETVWRPWTVVVRERFEGHSFAFEDPERW